MAYFLLLATSSMLVIGIVGIILSKDINRLRVWILVVLINTFSVALLVQFLSR